MGIESYTPQTGRMLREDGSVVNVADVLAQQMGLPINVCLYGASWGVVDLGATPPDSIAAQVDLETNALYKLGILITDVAKSFVGTALAAAQTGQGFANQPAGDSVTVRTNSAEDVGKTAKIYGTTNGTSVVLLGQKTIAAADADEDIALPDGTAKTDWGTVLGVEIDEAAVGTITFKEKSGGQTITTIAAAASSKGVASVAANLQDLHGLPVQALASGASTKLVGAVGLNPAGVAVYDAITLNGATAVNGLVGMATVTKLLFGDLEGARTATFKSGWLTYAAAGERITSLGTSEDSQSVIIPATYRYLHWVLSNGATPANGGAADWLHIKRR